ncbi:hypothetical protein GCM10010260_45400 [Streptomyces filipinensis]|uniref:DUF6294 domain-containing protein n=1 Tax=Streptomyces filipinensis TaxID=66887 RepID=A0A918MBS5_9ACTN|nr:DUF6294 family protein [Streptomyces filipinensis]GGV03538.1 hypothetical protein GCM10010260_45400 [Streptomyces filipinensis]
MTVVRHVGRLVTTMVAVLGAVLVLHTPAWAALDSDAVRSGVSTGYRSGLADDAYKWFSWGDLKVGDCHQTGGYLRLYADGRLTFSARTWTDFTLSGDVWHARFELKNSAGQGLFTTSTYDSPPMWASKKHDWTANGTYEPSVYDATVRVTQWASC